LSLKSKLDLTSSRLSFSYGDDDNNNDDDCDVDDYVYDVSKNVRVKFGCYDTTVFFVLTSRG